MTLKPWYKVITPRKDLRDGKPLDASEFAVHLGHIRDKRAPKDYQDPRRFFERTYLTKNLEALSAEVLRRLSGERTETSAVFNLVTQFGGGKTHALALLYHLTDGNPDAKSWMDVNRILAKAGLKELPKANIAVFVGTEFDSITGRGGENGEPLRKTPWGEIAWQLGKEEAYKLVEKHDTDMIVPGNDVIRKILEKSKPCIILMDELMNYVSRYRKYGMATHLYNFLHNLSEEARNQENVVLVVSMPASELEMTAEDHSDYERYKKMLDRLGKPMILSAEKETSEIIRRRLFEWEGVQNDGKKTANKFAEWIIDHHDQMGDFPTDNAKEKFMATYPFHPTVLSVFERKWQGLPRFQQTRGILRLLALWVSQAYIEGYKGAHRDPLITLGTAPLDNTMFRAAVFEQLGEERLEAAVTSDICGKDDAHAIILDKTANKTIKKARLHQKVAATIFFESNGGQLRADATIPEIRLSVGDPDLDIGNVETVLEELTESCYFLRVEKNRYRFSFTPTLNKILADHRAIIKNTRIDERVRAEIQTVFKATEGVDTRFFPKKSNQIPDRPIVTLIILPPEQSISEDKKLKELIESFTKEYGTSARTFKSSLIWVTASTSAPLLEQSRKLLAWEDIKDEKDIYNLDDADKRQLDENIKKAKRDLKEKVWITYKNLMLLGKDNQLKTVDLGLIHSSAADSLVSLILNRLRQDGDLEDGISPNFLLRNWPPAFKEWSTKSVRDAFFASPQFPKLLDPDTIKTTIANGVINGRLGYIGKTETGKYKPFFFEEDIDPSDIEISNDMFIITDEEAKRRKEPPKLSKLEVYPQNVRIETGKKMTFEVKGFDQYGNTLTVEEVEWSAKDGGAVDNGVLKASEDEGDYIIKATKENVSISTNFTVYKKGTTPPPPGPDVGTFSWEGDVPPQKWMNFYTKILSKFATEKSLKLKLKVLVNPEKGVSKQKIEEIKTALRELGLDDKIISE